MILSDATVAASFLPYLSNPRVFVDGRSDDDGFQFRWSSRRWPMGRQEAMGPDLQRKESRKQPRTKTRCRAGSTRLARFRRSDLIFKSRRSRTSAEDAWQPGW